MSPLRRIVVVGGSLAGLRAAETLRDEGFDGELTVVGAEDHLPYDRPPLSKAVLYDEAGADAAALRVREDLGVEWLLGRRATALELGRRRVRVDDSDDLEFDGLVVATGSVPRRLPVLDLEQQGILELRTLDDALVLREALHAGSRLILVGAGFIGVEVASSARRLGVEVDVVSLDPPLAIAGELISDVCTQMLVDHGVRLHVGRVVAEALGGDRLEAVVLDDGTRVEGDVLLVAVGARPFVDWLEGSGLTLDDGVVCDAGLAAVGAERVVAAGDIARWPNPLFGGAPARVEHWTNAVEQGAAAARTLLHGSSPETAFRSVPSFWSDHFGTRLQSVGMPGLADRVEVVAGSVEERQFVAAAYRSDVLVGATTYGMVRALTPYRIALARREPALTGA
jgi:3-phenylpropionate/trans-cinnamate dioxygenase ferredoxin reductase subunit